jgi:pimeloyl-ACP methyl ester carboxylesterase
MTGRSGEAIPVAADGQGGPAAGQRQWVTSPDGVRLNVEIYGRRDPGAPTVVLIHGWTCSVPFWAPVISALHGEFRLVAYDHRGHGASEPGPGRYKYSTRTLADDLAAVLDAVLPDGQQAVLAGHSMGGMTIMAAAPLGTLAGRVSGVLLASTGCADLRSQALVFPSRPLPWLAAAAHRMMLTSSAPMGPATALNRVALRYATLGPAATRDLAARNAAIVCACDRRVRAAWGRVLLGLDLADGIAHLDMPAQVLVGTADRLTPPAAARRLAEKLPHCAGLTELPGVGHMTPLEAPDTVADLIRGLAATGREPEPAAESAGAARELAAPGGEPVAGATTTVEEA